MTHFLDPWVEYAIEISILLVSTNTQATRKMYPERIEPILPYISDNQPQTRLSSGRFPIKISPEVKDGILVVTRM